MIFVHCGRGAAARRARCIALRTHSNYTYEKSSMRLPATDARTSMPRHQGGCDGAKESPRRSRTPGPPAAPTLVPTQAAQLDATQTDHRVRHLRPAPGTSSVADDASMAVGRAVAHHLVGHRILTTMCTATVCSMQLSWRTLRVQCTDTLQRWQRHQRWKLGVPPIPLTSGSRPQPAQ